jgi:hypothetical protein
MQTLLSEGLTLFKIATGMRINAQKSNILFSRIGDEVIQHYLDLLPFQTQNLEDGLKYLGFHLKPNDYRKNDWTWLLAKLEKRLQVWSNKWLSRAGRLVLIKLVLEAIPVYWMSLSWIPKGILEKARRMSFSYLWRGKSENRVMPWVRWEKIVKPKALGGWGLKNIFLFSKALAEKSVWRLITTTSLWTKVILLKYVAPLSLLEWIRSPGTRTSGISVMWKAVQ